MPYIERPIACGLELTDIQTVALFAVGSYRHQLFSGSIYEESPKTRTMLVALDFVKECLYCCSDDGQITLKETILLPGDEEYPRLFREMGPFPEEERRKCREYLGKLRAAVKEVLEVVINRDEEVRQWWLAVKQCTISFTLA